jgi:hypothetical protein
MPATDFETLKREYQGDEESAFRIRLELLELEYAQAMNHVMIQGPYRGQVGAMVLVSDEGLVELDRMAGDESAHEIDRLAAQILTHHPRSRARLDRMRCAANAAMDQRASS